MAKKVKVLLDSSKLREFSGSSIGVLVTLTPAPAANEDGDELEIVVGACAPVESDRSDSELEARGLPTPNWMSTVVSVLQHYPAGVRVSGIWVKVQPEELEPIMGLLIENTQLKGVFSERILVVRCDPDDATPPAIRAYVTPAATVSTSPLELSPVECAVPPDALVSRYLAQHTAMVRARGAFTLYVASPRDVPASMDRLVQKIQSPSSIFLLSSAQILFDESGPESTLRTVLPDQFKAASKSGSSAAAGLMAHAQSKPILVELLESTAASEVAPTELPVAPTLELNGPVKEGCVQLSLPVDALGLVQWETTLRDVAMCLKAALCAQLEAIKEEMLWKEGTLHSVSIHHFSLTTTQDSPVTIVYPDLPLAQLPRDEGVEPPPSLTNQELQPRQRIWRKLFGLPSKSSQLRVLSRKPVGTDLDWLASNNIRFHGPQLLNPHLAVKGTRVPGGTRRLVQGNYLYYHYKQDGFDDDGWGCAYRSLQTLWSWFLLQGYTDKPVAGHREIQEALVKVGDKESSFVGSKEWIGSFEVQVVLNQLLEVESKIQYTSTGEDMVGVGRVLLDHFKTEGTPVMIGGGVLAHTILGVDFCMATGEIKFLVLDPHHTGRDDIKVVLEKGMCAWKPATFWGSKAHYNMCMPLVPTPPDP